jgi:hypothetical protein
MLQSVLVALTEAMTPEVAVRLPVLLRLNQAPAEFTKALVRASEHPLLTTFTLLTVAVQRFPAASLTSALTVCVPFGYVRVAVAVPDTMVIGLPLVSGVPEADDLTVTDRMSAPVAVTVVGT